MLYLFGGLYLDSDVITIKPLPHESVQDFENVTFEVEDKMTNNAVLKFQRDHPFIKSSLEEMVMFKDTFQEINKINIDQNLVKLVLS